MQDGAPYAPPAGEWIRRVWNTCRLRIQRRLRGGGRSLPCWPGSPPRPRVRLRSSGQTDRKSPCRGELDFRDGVMRCRGCPSCVPGAVSGPLRRRACVWATLCEGTLTAARCAAARQSLGVTRGWSRTSSATEPWRASGWCRTAATLVPGFATALALVRGSDLVATVPERHCAALQRRSGDPAPALRWRGSGVAHDLAPQPGRRPAHRWLRPHPRDLRPGPWRGQAT